MSKKSKAAQVAVLPTDTGMSREGARALTDQIKARLDTTWQLIGEAYRNRAWVALGYSSWDDYCTREFGTSRIKLPREERSEVVASMREIGMSVRAISSATGAARNTVRNELRSDEVGQIDPPAKRPAITGTDGKTYQPSTTVIDVEVIESEPMTEAEEAARLEKERRDQAAREKAEREGRIQKYSNIFKSIRNLAEWGKYEDTPWVMEDFNPAELSPSDLYEVADEAEIALNFLDEFIAWRDGETPAEHEAGKATDLANDVRLLVTNMFWQKEVRALPDGAKRYLLDTLGDVSAELAGTMAENERSGASSWSRAIQDVSAGLSQDTGKNRLAIEGLSDDELAELSGAAEFLHNLAKGEEAIRKARR